MMLRKDRTTEPTCVTAEMTIAAAALPGLSLKTFWGFAFELLGLDGASPRAAEAWQHYQRIKWNEVEGHLVFLGSIHSCC
eukprot:jgi/Botrbrau1/10685/Bobra.139_2s0015.1